MESKKLKDICKIRSGTSFKKKPIQSDVGDFWVLESSAYLKEGSFNPKKMVHVSNDNSLEPSKSLKPGEVLIRAKGGKHQSIYFDYSGDRFPIYPTSYFLIISTIEPDYLRADYLSWYLNQNIVQGELDKLAGGSTVKHLTVSRISSLQVKVPSLEKQQKILELYGFIKQEKIIYEEIVNLKNEYYEAVISYFSGGFND